MVVTREVRWGGRRQRTSALHRTILTTVRCCSIHPGNAMQFKDKTLPECSCTPRGVSTAFFPETIRSTTLAVKSSPFNPYYTSGVKEHVEQVFPSHLERSMRSLGNGWPEFFSKSEEDEFRDRPLLRRLFPLIDEAFFIPCSGTNKGKNK